MNTRIIYIYGRAGRYTQRRSFIVDGELSITDLEPFLDDGKYFVPEDIGLEHPEPAEGYVHVPRNDGPFYELYDVEPTTAPGELNAEELVARFRAAYVAGWPGGNGANRRDITFSKKRRPLRRHQ